MYLRKIYSKLYLGKIYCKLYLYLVVRTSSLLGQDDKRGGPVRVLRMLKIPH